MKRRTALLALLTICGFLGGAGPAATKPATTKPATTRPAAKRIVLLLDFTGSMMNLADQARLDSRKQITALPEGTQFNVLVLNGDVVPFKKAMVPVTQANRLASFGFVDAQSPHGSGELIQLLRAAFEQNPEECWLYTDGEAPSWPKVFDEVTRLNKGKRVRINVMLNVAAEANEASLIKLAEMTGGVCVDRDGKPRGAADGQAKPK